MKYDAIMPVAFKDYGFLKKSCRYLCENLGAERIYILTDGRMARFLPAVIRRNPMFVVVDENRLVPGLTYQRIAAIIQSQGRIHTNVGWFFQQFLKMGFALSEHCRHDYYLSWDADTIPVKRLDFFDGESRPYFTMKSECHEPYFVTMKKLIGLDKINPSSYIAEHMMFNQGIMKELLHRIETADSVEGQCWYEKIMNAISGEEVSAQSFSEFETYGTFCRQQYPDKYAERTMQGFRMGGIIQGRFISDRILRDFISFDYSVVSFEIYHRPPFPWGIICNFYERRYLKYKQWILRRWIGR